MNLDPTSQRKIDEAERVQREEEFQARVQSWDRAMRRTFKGILPAPERRAMLERAADA